jgi:hypothetical protein
MKKKVKLSLGSLIASNLFLALLISLAVYFISTGNNVGWIIICSVIALGALAVFIYMPTSIAVTDDGYLVVNRPVHSTKIAVEDIDGMELCPPGEKKKFNLLASAGFYGYWGRFKERSLGKYFAFYGRASECFLVRLKNGKQYMLGCEKPNKLIYALFQKYRQAATPALSL